jgi:hypothetical protein
MYDVIIVLLFILYTGLENAAHAKATQAIEQHIAPGYEADTNPKGTRFHDTSFN